MIKYTYQNELEEENYAKIHDLFERKRSFDSRDDRPMGRKEYSRRDDRKKGNESSDSRENRFERKGKFSSDKGKSRMFLALGKKDDLNPKELLLMLKKKANVSPDLVTGIQISDAFSFFNVPPKESEIILSKLNSKDKGKRPIVERAKGK